MVTGAWNAAILTPEWLLRYGFQKPDGVQSSVEVQVPAGIGLVLEFPRYKFEDVTAQIRPDALVIRPSDSSEGSLAKVEFLARNAIAELKHTPINGIGHNFAFVEENPEPAGLEIFTASGKDLIDYLPNGWEVKKSTLSTAYEVGGVIVNVTRSFDGSRVVVKFNFHHPIASHQTALQALSGQNGFASFYANYISARGLIESSYGGVLDE